MEMTYKLIVLGCKENASKSVVRKKLERSIHSDPEKVQKIIERLLKGESFTLFDQIHQISAMTYLQQFEEMGIRCRVEESLGLLPQIEEYVCPACGHLQAIFPDEKEVCSKCGADRATYEAYLRSRDIIRAERMRMAAKKQFKEEPVSVDKKDETMEKFRQKIRKLLQKQYRIKTFGEHHVIFTSGTFLSLIGGLLLIAAAAGALNFYFSWQFGPASQAQSVARVERIIDLSPLTKARSENSGKAVSQYSNDTERFLSELKNPYTDVGAKIKSLGVGTDGRVKKLGLGMNDKVQTVANTDDHPALASNGGSLRKGVHLVESVKKDEPVNVQRNIDLAMYHAATGDSEQAYRYLARATDIVNLMDDDARRSLSDVFNKSRIAVLTTIAKQKIASGHIVSAEEHSNLVGIVDTIADPAERAQAFSFIGTLFKDSNSASGQSFFDLALRDVGAVADPQKQIMVLSTIAGNLAKAGYSREADDLFGKALALNRRIAEAGAQATGLSIIARSMAESGNPEGARSILTEALNTFATGDRSSSGYRLTSEFKKNYAVTMSAAAKNLMLKGDVAKAKEEFSDALVQADRIDDAKDRSQALLHLATQVAEAGDSPSATDIAAHATGFLQ